MSLLRSFKNSFKVFSFPFHRKYAILAESRTDLTVQPLEKGGIILEHTFDALVVGAGYAGAVCARQLAEGGKRVLVLERRDHIGGNAYDRLDGAGVLIHQYGPHIFHTNNKRVFDWLSRFTVWRDYQHRVLANLPDGQGGRQTYPVPFNLTSLETAFGPAEGARLGEKLIAAYGAEKKVTILELRQARDPEIAALADYVYEHVFVHYTMKQWGQTPEEIDPNTTARVPVFLSRDDRYFQDAYQGMPLEGYTVLFQRMLDHPGITVELGTDALKRLDLSEGRICLDGAEFSGPVIYTGQADELFAFRFGPLPYRTLDFRFETLAQDDFQGCGTVNYTVDEDYINPENDRRYAQYRAEAERFPNLHLLGRLAEYKYYNMDAIAARALELAGLLT